MSLILEGHHTLYQLNSTWNFSSENDACLCAKLLQLCPTLCDLMGCSPPGLSMGFCRQDYWSGLPGPSSRDLPDLGIKPESPALQADSLPLSHPGSPFLRMRTLAK